MEVKLTVPGASPITIDDLDGIVFPNTTSLEVITDRFPLHELRNSDDLETARAAGDIELYREDGNTLITAQDLLDASKWIYNTEMVVTAPTAGQALKAYDAGGGVIKWRPETLAADLSLIQVTFGKRGNSNDTYLRLGGDVSSNESGLVMPYAGTIVAVSTDTSDASVTYDAEVHVNGSLLGAAKTTVSGASEGYTAGLAEGLSAGDNISAFVNGTGPVKDVTITVWIRLTTP
jgi:hypothetical protein